MIMSIIEKLMIRYRWSFVGTVTGVTRYVKEDGTDKAGGVNCCYWNLYQRGDGKRKFSLIGRNLGSALSNQREAQVEAWKRGGPVPPLNESAQSASPSPKPKAKLISFPGGKDGAA